MVAAWRVSTLTGATAAQVADHRQDPGASPPPASTGAAPGRVLSPPTSRMSAPASSMAWPAVSAARRRDGQPAVREAVRRDVDDAHHQRPARVAAGSPAKGGSGRVSGQHRAARPPAPPRRAPARSSPSSQPSQQKATAARPSSGRRPCRIAQRPPGRAGGPAVRSSAPCRAPTPGRRGGSGARRAGAGSRRRRCRVRPRHGPAARSARCRGPAFTGSSGRLRTIGSPRMHLPDLVARERLVLQQALGQQVQLVDVLGQQSASRRA